MSELLVQAQQVTDHLRSPCLPTAYGVNGQVILHAIQCLQACHSVAA